MKSNTLIGSSSRIPTTACEALREGSIPSGISELCTRCEELHKSIDSLTDRLHNVTRPLPIGESEKDILVKDTKSVLNGQISNIAERVRSATQRLNELQEKMDL